MTTHPPDSTWFQEAIRRFDAANSHDPNSEMVDGVPQPHEWVYAQRLTDWVLRLCPTASEPLRLAARCQHLCRWMIPRDRYPMNRPGYLLWREDLKKFHAEKSGEILREVGYPDEVVARVQNLNRKAGFPNDPETRVLEDALCLVFLQYQLTELAERNPPEKVINALKKSWQKMTPAGWAYALTLNYSPQEKALLDQALKPA